MSGQSLVGFIRSCHSSSLTGKTKGRYLEYLRGALNRGRDLRGRETLAVEHLGNRLPGGFADVERLARAKQPALSHTDARVSRESAAARFSAATPAFFAAFISRAWASWASSRRFSMTSEATFTRRRSARYLTSASRVVVVS